MNTVIDQVMGQLSAQGLGQISERIGADEDTTGTALATAMPLLLSALAQNASKPEGATSLHQALAKDHDGSVLQNLGGYLGSPDLEDGAGILRHVLGAKEPVVEERLAKGTGLNTGQAAQLLQIAAPLLLGALGQQQSQQGLGASGLASLLGGQQQELQQAKPDMMSVLNSLLDADKDGSAVDEVMGFVGKLFGKK
jgi:hypothetical protein